MTTAELLDRRPRTPGGVHLSVALCTSGAGAASTGVDDTLDGELTSIEVWDHGALVAYREPALERAS